MLSYVYKFHIYEIRRGSMVKSAKLVFEVLELLKDAIVPLSEKEIGDKLNIPQVAYLTYLKQCWILNI